MQLAALQRWHWIVIALVVGLVIGAAQDVFDSGVSGIQVNGVLILPSQQVFENALVQEFQDGTRAFTNATIYTHQVSDPRGGKKTVDVVMGNFAQREEGNGVTIYRWKPRAFVAYRPYKPTIGIPASNGATPATEYPSVGEFLAAMHHAYHVTYRYAWWANHPIWTWLIGSLVVIGGIWPTVVNLLTFGRFTRPPEAKALSLWKVRQPRPAAKPVPVMSDFAMPSGGDEEPSAADQTAAPAAEESAEETIARMLEGGPLELAPDTEKEAHEYSAKPDDYYPTERLRRKS